MTSIRKGAFYGCSLLAQITIPSSVNSIRNSVFFYYSTLIQLSNFVNATSFGEATLNEKFLIFYVNFIFNLVF